MTEIKEYIEQFTRNGYTYYKIAKHLDFAIKEKMIGHYITSGHMPSVCTAKAIYKKDKVAIFPYSKDALIELIRRDEK